MTNRQLSGYIFLAGLLAIIAMALLGCKEQEHNYSHKDIAAMNALTARVLAEHKQPLHVRQAQAYYEIWNLTERDVASPVCLFGTEGKCI